MEKLGFPKRVKFRTDDRFRWLDRVMLLADLPPAAYRIAYYFAHDCAGPASKGIFPKQDTIADRFHISRDTVKRALRSMEKCGILHRVTKAVQPDRKSTYYVLTWPTDQADLPRTQGANLHPHRGQECTNEPPLIEPTPLPHGRGGLGSTESIGSREIPPELIEQDPDWNLRREYSQFVSVGDEIRARGAPGSSADIDEAELSSNLRGENRERTG